MRRLAGIAAGVILIALGVAHSSAGMPRAATAAAPTPTPTPSDDPRDPPPGGIGGGGGPVPAAHEIRPRTLTARWGAGGVVGTLRGDALCVGHARVVLYRRGHRVASAYTTTTGRYRITAAHRAGRYRVRAPAVQRLALDCQAAAHVVG